MFDRESVGTRLVRWKRGIKRGRRVRTSVLSTSFGAVACHFRSPSSVWWTQQTRDKKRKKNPGKSDGRGTRSAPATVSFQTITLVILYALPGYQFRRRGDVRRRRTPRSVATPRVAGRAAPLTWNWDMAGRTGPRCYLPPFTGQGLR